jgi:hypothetical protein
MCVDLSFVFVCDAESVCEYNGLHHLFAMQLKMGIPLFRLKHSIALIAALNLCKTNNNQIKKISQPNTC